MKKLFTCIILYSITIAAVSAQPAIKWSKNFGGSGTDQVGDYTNYYDAPNHCIANTSDGGFILAGYSDSNDSDAMSNNGGNDILIIKCDANGIRQWSKSIGGTGDDIATS